MTKWTENERERQAKKWQTPYARTERAIALYILMESGDVDLSNKSDLARQLGTNRWSLDRDLAAIERAKQIVVDYRSKL